MNHDLDRRTPGLPGRGEVALGDGDQGVGPVELRPLGKVLAGLVLVRHLFRGNSLGPPGSLPGRRDRLQDDGRLLGRELRLDADHTGLGAAVPHPAL